MNDKAKLRKIGGKPVEIPQLITKWNEQSGAAVLRVNCKLLRGVPVRRVCELSPYLYAYFTRCLSCSEFRSIPLNV